MSSKYFDRDEVDAAMWLDPILARLVADDRVPDSCPPQIQVLFLWVLKRLKKFWKQLFFLGSGAWCIRRTENQVIAIIIHDKHCKLNQTFYYLFFEVHFKTINGDHWPTMNGMFKVKTDNLVHTFQCAPLCKYI